jgi:molybdenum cofactor biosynthesis protein MoaC
MQETHPRIKMIDVGAKTATFRRAFAQGKITLSKESFNALVEKKNPKGDVLAVAQIAGIQAAKRTADFVPLCHPLPLDEVRIDFDLDHSAFSITVHCVVSTTAKTGVEMEALCGVNGALLAIYDLSKAVDPVLTISEIRLNRKEGGKSGVWLHPLQPAEKPEKESLELSGVKAAILTISDRCSKGEAEDLSGPLLAKCLQSSGAEMVECRIVPDDIPTIRNAVIRLIREHHAELVVCTGGTGLSPRDVTPEALEILWTKRIPGIGEHLRAEGSKQTPMAWWGRTESGMIDQALVVSLPGSLRAVQQGWELLRDILPHALHVAKGGSH